MATRRVREQAAEKYRDHVCECGHSRMRHLHFWSPRPDCCLRCDCDQFVLAVPAEVTR